MNFRKNVRKSAAFKITALLIILLLTSCAGSENESTANGSNPGTGGSGNPGGSGELIGTATISWLPPTENTDGSILDNLAGFKIYYGTTSGDYTDVIVINNPGIAQYLVDKLATGNTYYFVVTAVAADGYESRYSLEGSKTIYA